MSDDQIKAFLVKAQSDPSLLAKIKNAKDQDSLAAVAKEAGFSLSGDYFKNMTSEVSEDELEAVNGGTPLSIIVYTVVVK